MDSDERIFEIELERLKDFPQHPFKVLEDRQMIELMESIRTKGNSPFALLSRLRF